MFSGSASGIANVSDSAAGTLTVLPGRHGSALTRQDKLRMIVPRVLHLDRATERVACSHPGESAPYPFSWEGS